MDCATRTGFAQDVSMRRGVSWRSAADPCNLQCGRMEAVWFLGRKKVATECRGHNRKQRSHLADHVMHGLTEISTVNRAATSHTD